MASDAWSWAGRRANRLPLIPDGIIHMGPLNRYIDRSLHEGELISQGEHFLVAYTMKARAGHGAVTSRQSKRGYTALALAQMSRLQGASGIHVGAKGLGKMEGHRTDRQITYMRERDECLSPARIRYAWPTPAGKRVPPPSSGPANTWNLRAPLTPYRTMPSGFSPADKGNSDDSDGIDARTALTRKWLLKKCFVY